MHLRAPHSALIKEALQRDYVRHNHEIRIIGLPFTFIRLPVKRLISSPRYLDLILWELEKKEK